MTNGTAQEVEKAQDQGQEEPAAAAAAVAAETKVDTESMTLPELLDYRYSLPAEEKSGVKANSSIANNPGKMLLWSFHCVFQDSPILVMLGCAVVLYHAFKFAIDLVQTLI